MASLTDQQLLLLEQLTYYTSDVDKAAGVFPQFNGLNSMNENHTLWDILGRFDEAALATLDADGTTPAGGGNITKGQWAAIIRAIQADPELMNLALVKKDECSGSYCFYSEETGAVVAFRGTYDGDEWYDNFTGLGTSDTEIQQKALDFIESLEYENISIVGHSKGGNKAMYCALLSDKVDHALSLDGQGFSQEFLNKYSDEIEKNSQKISAISLDQDFVHILLYAVPGVETIYYKKADDVNLADCHSPSSLYYYEQINGQWVVSRNSDGSIRHIETKEAAIMTHFHDFTLFVLKVCPIDKRREIGDYLGHIMGCIMRKSDGNDPYSFSDIDGKRYNSDNIMEYILKHGDSLGAVLAYLFKYQDIYGLSAEEMQTLIQFLGLEDVVRQLIDGAKEFTITHPTEAGYIAIAGRTSYEILRLVMSNITDGKEDPHIQELLSWLSKWLNEKLNINMDLGKIWTSIEKEYIAIGDIDAATSTVNTMNTNNSIYDYSLDGYNKLVGVMNHIDQLTSDSINHWNEYYSSEEWYSSLAIHTFVAGISSYGERIQEINQTCRTKIDSIYNEVGQIDKAKANEIQTACCEIEVERGRIMAIAERLR